MPHFGQVKTLPCSYEVPQMKHFSPVTNLGGENFIVLCNQKKMVILNPPKADEESAF